MSFKEYEEGELETTKEIIDLEALNEDANDEFQSDMLKNMDEADLQFQEEVERLDMPEDTVIIEPEKGQKKKKKFKEKLHDLKEKWKNLSKKKKAIIIICTLLVIILLTVGLIFLFKKEEPIEEDIPDVILEEDNYRYENGVLHFLDDDNELGTYECENKDEKLCYVAYLTMDDDFDGLKQVDEEEKEIKTRSHIYNERYVFVFDNQKKDETIVKLYDMKENEVKDEYLSLKAYEDIEDIAIVKDLDSKVGLIRLNDDVKEVLPFEYDYLGIFKDSDDLSRVVAKNESGYYLINEQNSYITSAISSPIVGANTTHVKTKGEDGTYHVYSYNGEEVGTGEYAYLLDAYVLFVRNNSLYITDYQKHPMNIEGIPLYNDTYNPIATYKNNKLVKTEKSFEAEVYDQTLTLKIYNGENDTETKTVNLREGAFSSTLGFINYFDGKLYFYKDEQKTQELGSYSCNNKNSIDNDTKELNNCTLAKESFFVETNNDKEKDLSDSLGIIPVFNERFIFIKDGNDEIVLYDLKENANKATYTEVDTKSYTKATNITFVNTNNVYYIGKSHRSGKFGLAKITPDKVEVQIEFDYKSIKRLGDYYVLESDDGYSLSDLGGQLISNKKSAPIVDYNGNYLKTFKDNQYKISGFKQNETNDTFDYVELYDNYYATVSDSKLSIYKYNEEEPKYTLEQKLNSKNYNGDGVRAFKLTFNSTNVKIEIGNDGGYTTVENVDLAKVTKPANETNNDNNDKEQTASTEQTEEESESENE